MNTKSKRTRVRGSRTPRSIGAVLGSAVPALRLEEKFEEYAAFPQWEEIVGTAIASVAKPEKIVRNRVLIVRVLDAAWAQELSMQKQQLLDKIFASGLGATLEDIHFISGSPQSIKGPKR